MKQTKARIMAVLLAFGLIFSSAGAWASQDTGAVTPQAGEAAADPAAADPAAQPAAPAVNPYIEQGLAMPVQSNEWSGWPEGPIVSPHAAILMDVDTREVLYAKNITDAHYPASITKVMTGLLAVENGQPDQTVTFSQEAVYGIEYGSANAGMLIGEQISLDTALRVLFAWSANEVANGIAETIGGTIDNFAEMMNAKVQQLGGVNSHFVNPHGLFNEDHYTCCYDMALIASEAYQSEWFRSFCNLPYYNRPLTEMNPTDNWNMTNRHQMLHDDNAWYYPGVTGGKTGFTVEAHNTLVTFAERDGLRLVCVVMYGEGTQVYEATHALLDYGFDNFTHIQAKSLADRSVIQKIASDFVLTVPSSEGASAVTTSLEKEKWNRATLQFEMHGEPVGSMKVTLTPEYMEQLASEEATYQVEEEKEVSKESFGQKAGAVWEKVKQAAVAVWNWIKALPVVILIAVGALIVILIVIAVIRKKLRKARNAKKIKKDTVV